jgi:hypothetical protein
LGVSDGEVVIIVVGWILIFLVIGIGYQVFRDKYPSKKDRQIKNAIYRKTIDTKSIQSTIDGSNAGIWKWAMYDHGDGGALMRKMQRKDYLKLEGIKESKYSGSGYIYIVPATLRHNKTNMGFAYDPYYQTFTDWNSDRWEPQNYQELVEKFKQMLGRFPYWRDYDQRPYKIGYTTRDPKIRMKELNEYGSNINYMDWQFEYNPSFVWVEKNVEMIESKIHWALRDGDKEIAGEIFCASWDEIESIVKRETGNEIILSDSRKFTKDEWPHGDDYPQGIE